MYVGKRVLKDGSFYYGFSYDDDTGKRIRLPKSSHPHFTNKKEAEEWANSQEAFRESRRAAVERKLSWRSKYYDFAELMKKYRDYQKKKSPSSYKDWIYSLEQYVFPWFLNVKHAANINDWWLLFQEFSDYLTGGTCRTTRDKPPAKNTVNNIVKSLNSFIDFLKVYHLIDDDSAKKCPHLTDLPQRGVEAVIPLDEARVLRMQIGTRNIAAAEFFWLLYHSGIRKNECASLRKKDLYAGDIEHASLADELRIHNIKYYGYLIVESQLDQDDEEDPMKRKPLKGRKKVEAGNSRIVPIEDKDVWNILARRHQACANDEALLFDELSDSALTRAWIAAENSLGYPHRSPHFCRHSYITNLAGRTRSFFLCRLISGHRDSKSFERYKHLFLSNGA